MGSRQADISGLTGLLRPTDKTPNRGHSQFFILHSPACVFFWTNLSILAKLSAIIFTTYVTLETFDSGRKATRSTFRNDCGFISLPGSVG
jgi:hypothetical protein